MPNQNPDVRFFVLAVKVIQQPETPDVVSYNFVNPRSLLCGFQELHLKEDRFLTLKTFETL